MDLIENNFESFVHRHPKLNLKLPASFFGQLFNLFDDHMLGIKKVLLDRIDDHQYSTYADEQIRIISYAIRRIANEIGAKSLDRPEYIFPDFGYDDYRIFKNYVYDQSIGDLEKLSMFEYLFAETTRHIETELRSLAENLVRYENQSNATQILSEKMNSNIYDEGAIKYNKAIVQQQQKTRALNFLSREINERLRFHSISLYYDRGRFSLRKRVNLVRRLVQGSWRQEKYQRLTNLNSTVEVAKQPEKSDLINFNKKSLFKKLWSDPVWSKVIGAVILAVGAYLWRLFVVKESF